MQEKHAKWTVVIAAALLTATSMAQDNHENHAHDFSRDVDAFHAVLAPLWHSRQGKERSRQVCAQAQKLENLANGIHSGDAKKLLASIAALRAQCQARPTDIDASFSDVHEAFHCLIEPAIESRSPKTPGTKAI
jgi:hypothetical protein